MVEERSGQRLIESPSINESNALSEAERCLLKKCDRRILPISFCLMAVAPNSRQKPSQEPSHCHRVFSSPYQHRQCRNRRGEREVVLSMVCTRWEVEIGVYMFVMVQFCSNAVKLSSYNMIQSLSTLLTTFSTFT